MKKSLILLVVLAITVCFLGGCQPQVSETVGATENTTQQTPLTNPVEQTQATERTEVFNCDELLLSALNGQIPIVTQNGHVEFLCDYLRVQHDTFAVRYAMVDFDQDMQNEMVIETSSAVASYIVLHYSDPDIFAFPFGGREMIGLHTDGSFIGGAGANCTYYLTMRFNGGGYVIINEAVADAMEGVFEINSVACSEDQIRAFEDNWQSREDAVWTILEEAEVEEPIEETAPPQQQTPTPYLQTIGRADQSIYAGPGYDYGFVCTVELAGVYTIVEEMWDMEGNLWGRLKSGVGWVNLTEVRSAEVAAEPISANYADAQLISSGNYYHCIADTSEYMVQVAFRAYETLYDFSLFTMEFSEHGPVAKEQVYFLSTLTPEKPLVADVAFPGDLSMYGIRFTDSSGTVCYYTIMTSGRDGSLSLSKELF